MTNTWSKHSFTVHAEETTRVSGKSKKTDLAQAGEGKDGVILRRRNYQWGFMVPNRTAVFGSREIEYQAFRTYRRAGKLCMTRWGQP